MKTRSALALLLLTCLLGNCNKSPDTAANTTAAPTTNTFIFQITEIADHPHVHFPNDTVSEHEFQADSNGRSYDVRFSADEDTVFVKHDSLICIRVSEVGVVRKYNITNWMAGGRFLVLLGMSPLKAELTQYGSGVPIIRSERGVLLPAR